MSKTILVNSREARVVMDDGASRDGTLDGTLNGEVRVAILDNDLLYDFDIETEWRQKTKGNIYRAQVANLEPSLQAAFINYGAERHGFLPISDVADLAHRPDAPKNPRTITDALRRKQVILVQVLKEELGNKGAALTTYVSLPGRYLVLTVGEGGGGISRKIENEEERQRMRDIIKALKVPDGFGIIVRTAGMEQPKIALQRDLKYLLKVWDDVQAQVGASDRPGLVHKDHDVVVRTLRDYLTPDVERIVFDTEPAFRAAKEFLKLNDPKRVKQLELYEGKRPLLSEFGVESQIEALFVRRVPLPSGGSLVIDRTEALVAIDVNSGKMTKEKSQEETAYRTNLEAVVEAARQLRLRDLGGIIVLDLIDMESVQYREEVERRFKDAVKQDKARIKIGHISPAGLLELTRQRIRPALLEGVMATCRHCEGTGQVRAGQSESSRLLRAIADRLATELAPGDHATITLQARTDTAVSMLNHRRSELVELGRRFGVRIEVVPSDDLGPPYFAILLAKDRGPDKDRAREPARPPSREQSQHHRAEAHPPGQARQEPPREPPPPARQSREAAPSQESPAAPPPGEAGTGRRRRRRRGRRGGALPGPQPALEAGVTNQSLAPTLRELPEASDDEDAFEVAIIPFAGAGIVEPPAPGPITFASSDVPSGPRPDGKVGGGRRRRRRGRRGGAGETTRTPDG